jgi:phosphoenolpyruvate synthase/pyruvate phosphate dikinase
MIDAAWGWGKAIVGSVVTPDTLIVNRRTGAIASQEIADKEVMTVRSPARTDQAVGDTIEGIGASPGRVAGVARVIHDPGEFNQMRPGDGLVAKITTPAWTPLFALAASVVTDVGGPPSHSSIVAREYHIPAVLHGDLKRRQAETIRVHAAVRRNARSAVGARPSVNLA